MFKQSFIVLLIPPTQCLAIVYQFSPTAFTRLRTLAYLLLFLASLYHRKCSSARFDYISKNCFHVVDFII